MTPSLTDRILKRALAQAGISMEEARASFKPGSPPAMPFFREVDRARKLAGAAERLAALRRRPISLGLHQMCRCFVGFLPTPPSLPPHRPQDPA